MFCSAVKVIINWREYLDYQLILQKYCFPLSMKPVQLNRLLLLKGSSSVSVQQKRHFAVECFPSFRKPDYSLSVNEFFFGHYYLPSYLFLRSTFHPCKFDSSEILPFYVTIIIFWQRTYKVKRFTCLLVFSNTLKSVLMERIYALK